MKIVHYLSSMSRSAGGLFYSVSGIAKAQASQSHDVTVIGGADQYADEDRRMWHGLTLHTHPYKSHGYGFDRRVPGMIAAVAPDVLHIHGIWSAASIYGYLAARKGIATFVSPRGMLDPWILKRKPAVKAIHGRLFEGPLLKRAVAHALNTYERDSIVRFMAPAAVRTIVVPNGVDLRTVDPIAPRSGAVYLGRLHEKKQVLELISAWTGDARLKGVSLTIAGWGAPDYEAQVATACNAAANVEFVGSAYGEEKIRLLQNASFFLLPSLSEGLPMAVLEAMSAGAIPIMTAECNLPELFEQDAAIEMRADFTDFTRVAERIAGAGAADLAALRARVAEAIKAYAWDQIATTMLNHYRGALAMSKRD